MKAETKLSLSLSLYLSLSLFLFIVSNRHLLSADRGPSSPGHISKARPADDCFQHHGQHVITKKEREEEEILKKEKGNRPYGRLRGRGGEIEIEIEREREREREREMWPCH